MRSPTPRPRIRPWTRFPPSCRRRSCSRRAKGLATGKPGFVGEASVELRATDGQTGELVAAGVDRRVGGKSVSGAPTDSWDDVREAYRYWAKQLRYRLCTERGATDCTSPQA
ncbi:MAG TPA: DUF3313 family protein [Geminicoccaceae bacterium]